MAVRRARGAPPPRRRHAQHFLRSTRLAAEIVRDTGLGRDDLVLDIGAGTGTLTAELARSAARVRAIEIDPGLVERLRERFACAPRVEIVHGDALRVPLPTEPFRIVANIPFNATAAILRHLLDDPRVPLERADLIVELGAALKRSRISPATALGAYRGAWFELALTRRLDASAFAPRPDADAGVLRIVRRTEPLVRPADAAAYGALVRSAFDGRGPIRHTLRGTLSPRELKRLAREHGFSPDAQPWELDQHQWAAVFRFVRRRAVDCPGHEPL